MFFKENGQYRCAVYLRLSRSDGDQQESNSIKNQRALLNDYLGKHPELHKVDEYVDDGYSGTNFERPDFKRMMQDIENRKINCIIVKDLSRFGRNYILDEEEYSQLKEHYIAEKQRLEHELQKQRQRSLELEKRMRICDEQMERMRAILNQKEFDEELVHELIKKIYVGIDNSVEIEFKCSDPYQEVLAFVAEVQNE